MTRLAVAALTAARTMTRRMAREGHGPGGGAGGAGGRLGGPRLRQGMVDAVNGAGTKADVIFGDDGKLLTGLPILGCAVVRAGDSTWALHQPPMPPIILGPLAPLGAHPGIFSGTTDASGNLTVTHGAGFTPRVVVVTGGTPIASTPNIPAQVVADPPSFAATTFRLRAFAVGTSTGLNAVAITGSYVCYP